MLKSTVESVTLAGELVDKNLEIAPNDPHVLQIATFHTWLKVNLGMTDDPASEINKGVDLLSRGIKLVTQGEPIYIYLLAQKSIWQAILQKFDQACAVIPELKQYERRIYDDHLSQFDFGLLHQVCFSDGSFSLTPHTASPKLNHKTLVLQHHPHQQISYPSLGN